MRKTCLLPLSNPRAAILYCLRFAPLAFAHSWNSSDGHRYSVLLGRDTEQDIDTIYQRRLSVIAGGLLNASSVTDWIASMKPDGSWPDVDYTSGCAAQRANWPAEVHWTRLATMAGAWTGGLPQVSQLAENPVLGAKISLGMDWWFDRDFVNPACVDSGGTPSCPCDEGDTLWDTNWFSNIIGVPQFVGQACLLMKPELSSTQLSNCTHMTARSFGTFGHDVHGLGPLTGANTLGVATIAIDGALLNQDAHTIADALNRVHAEVTIKNATMADGVRYDGSFGQHGGILYNGNYGKDYINDAVELEIEAAGTQFTSNEQSSQLAIASYFDAGAWMIYQNTMSDTLHWDFSVVGRFITFPVIDGQATASTMLNLTQINLLGESWGSTSIVNFAHRLLSSATTSANAGQLEGNKMFYANDYMVHRGKNYVVSVKMYSTRTRNTECVNSQNPLGFHLSDGTMYTYLQGDEYEDIAGAWDWDLIPGTTVDYRATPLNCDQTGFVGNESLVGGVSNGQIGLAVMRYTNPLTGSLSWQKAWFMLPGDIQHVMIANLSSSGKPVYSVLDQKRLSGDILIDGIQHDVNGTNKFAGSTSLWHSGVGYSFNSTGADLTVQAGSKTADWGAIGISTQPPQAIDLFAAWLEHTSIGQSLSYTAFPGTDFNSFIQKSQGFHLQTLQNDASVSAVFDSDQDTMMAMFWQRQGGSVSFNAQSQTSITLKANGSVAVIWQTGNVTIADPSQSLSSVVLCIEATSQGQSRTTTLTFGLPTEGALGGSVTKSANLALQKSTNENEAPALRADHDLVLLWTVVAILFSIVHC